MKMRRQTSHNPVPRSITTSVSRRGEEADAGLGFNTFRTSSESVFRNESSENVPKSGFSFGAGSSKNPSVVLDDIRTLKHAGDKNYANAIGSNAAFSFKAFDSENKKSFDESMVDQLPKELNNLNIGGSSNVASTNIFQDATMNPVESQFTHTLSSNTETELQQKMHKMNLGKSGNAGLSSDNLKSFVFGNNSKTVGNLSGKSESVIFGKQQDYEKVKADLLSDMMGELKVSGAGDDNFKSFVFGTNSKTGGGFSRRPEPDDEKVKPDLLADMMGELKVSGADGDNLKSFVFGTNNKTGGGAPSSAEHTTLGKQHDDDKVKADSISEMMRDLKVGGGGEASGFPTIIDNKMQGGSSLGNNLGFDRRNVEPKTFESPPSIQSHPFGNASFIGRSERSADFTFTGKLDNSANQNVELKTLDSNGDLFSFEEDMLKKNGEQRKPVLDHLWPKQDFMSGQRSSSENPDSFEAYSPMDASPYHETLVDDYSRGTSVRSDDASQMDDINSVSSESHIINLNITMDENLLVATQPLDVDDGDVNCALAREENFEEESFRTATGNMEYSNDTFATAYESDFNSTATSGMQEKEGTQLFRFGAELESASEDNFTFAASLSTQGQLSPGARQHKKKNRLKTGQDSYSSAPDAKNVYASSSSADFFSISGSSSLLPTEMTKNVDMIMFSSKNKDNLKPLNEQDSKHGTFSTPSASIAAEASCEKWRLRGNQAYGNGDLAKAEDYYTQGLNSVSQTEKSRDCLRAQMLCYSNRAATRISLGRMREALKDCLMAAAIDPNFLKVQVRAAHCYLAIGEVENATLRYMKCLQTGHDVCVDKKISVEASEGLEKAKKVSGCIKQYAKLSQRTSDDLECALRVIDEALKISTYSEELLQMKADTLFMLRMYEQVIQMCEQTLTSAEVDTHKNSSSWRLNLIVKSYFYLGRLEEALEFIKNQESSGHITERLESMGLESVIPLVDTIRELISCKEAGNEAYKSGKYAEAVEQYTAALSCSVESRPFAAICFCNRAAAYRALGQIADAIADCSLAIALDPNYLKAISRRVNLYEMIRDYGQAAVDLRKLVSLLTSQIEEKGALSGVSDTSNCMNELRQAQLQLYNTEEESRKEIPLNMYLILGVETTASASEIKKAYRKAALKHHPDKAALLLSRSDNENDSVWKEIAENVYKDADRLFKMIAEAYAVLSNPSKKSWYELDEEMRNEVNKFSRSGSGRMSAESPVFERSGSRRFEDSWKPYVHTPSTLQQKSGPSPYRYS